MTPAVSLVVANYGRRDEVEALVASLQACPPSCAWEMVVVNVGETRPYGPAAAGLPVAAVTLAENRGYGGAINHGLAQTSGAYILALNSDILFPEDCLPAALSYLERHAGTGVLVPRLTDRQGAPQYSARRFYTPLAILCRRTPLGRLLPSIDREHLYMDNGQGGVFPVDWGQGAALLVRRELVQEGRLFDERFFLYFEDVDLCARAWQQGWRVEYFGPMTLIHHHRRSSAGVFWGRSARHHLRSLWRFWRKWGTLWPGGAERGPR